MPTDAHGREPGSPHFGEPAAVDSSGKPEGPVQQAVEKSKNENRVKAGLALAAVGIVVAIVLARRSSSGAGAASSGYPPSGAGGLPPGSDPGSGIDSSYIQSLQGEIGGLSQQLGQQQSAFAAFQTHEAATNAQLVAQNKAQNTALAGLNKRIGDLIHAEQGKGHTPADRAHSPLPPHHAGPGSAQDRNAALLFIGQVLGGKAPLPKGQPVPAGYTMNPKTRLLTKKPAAPAHGATLPYRTGAGITPR